MSDERNSKFSLEWLSKSIREKCPEMNLGELVSVVSSPINGDDVSFTSDVEKLRVIFNNETNTKQITFSLISKISKHIKAQDALDIWTNRIEVEIYVHVLTQMEKLMLEFNDDSEISWPKLYGHVPYSIMLLEDVSQDAIAIRQAVCLKEDFAILGLKAIARFHAMSKILLERGIVGEEYKDKYVFGKKNAFQEKFFSSMLHLLSTVMIEGEGRWKTVESSKEWGEKLKLLRSTVCDKREQLYLNYDKRFSVLNHGDYRTSNMMFRTMEHTDRPIAAKFFDFQFPHVNSFCWDVAYFLGLSVDSDCRRKGRRQLLQAYQQSLADNLIFFNFDGYIPTIDDVVNEIDRVALAEFLTVACTSQCVKVQNAIALDKILTHRPEEAIKKCIYAEEAFVEDVVGDFERVVDLKII